MCLWLWLFFFFNQKTAYEMRISDWSSDVCSSDLDAMAFLLAVSNFRREGREIGRLVIDVQPFAVLQPTHHPVGYRGQQHFPTHLQRKIGRASCRERVCQYV